MNSRALAGGPRLLRCGETGWLMELADNQAVHRWAAAVREAALPGVVDIVPGMTTLLVTVEPDITTLPALRAALAGLRPHPPSDNGSSRHTIEVRYDGEDLHDVARLTGMTPAEVVTAHTGTPWQVAFCGFAPGFAYLIGGDPRLRVPRRDEARVRVPRGSVAIAGEFSSVYPRASPGGWQLLGHTDAALWDIAATPPSTLLPGAVVQFVDISTRSPRS